MTKVTFNAGVSNIRKTSATAGKAVRTYRGVTLHKPAGKSSFSAKQVDNAVKAAIAKNGHVFTGDD